VVVSGSGFADSSEGSIVECNNDPSQPTITLLGNAVPVSCTDALDGITSTTAAGDLASTNFTVVEGTVGPPTSGTDSTGGNAATDAASYPCPPTAAQVTAGYACVISFGDLGGDAVSQVLTFATGGEGTTTTTTSSTTTTTSTTVAPTTTTTTAAATTSTTVPCNAKSASSSGSPLLTVDPGTCLNGGTVVTVTGSGFDAKSPGAIVECNDAPGQPNFTLDGFTTLVSCSNPLTHIITMGSDGSVPSTSFTIIAGTTGPPGSGNDSTGSSAAADAANYPCPPTTAQVAAGDTCQLLVEDLAGKKATVPITFVPAGVVNTSSTAAAATTGANTSSTASTAASTTATTAAVAAASTSSLAFTGPGHGVWVLAIGGLVLINLGFLVLLMYYRPRELFSGAARRAYRLFGGGGGT
jgi:hypothetical protein